MNAIPSPVKNLIDRASKLFSDRWSLNDYWQTCAENFYPERADFTVANTVGESFMDYLTTSYPVIARRDLGNSLGAMLRTDDWFQITVKGAEGGLDKDGEGWLEWATNQQRNAMYNRDTMFTRATKEGDHDFATFGQCAISVEVDKNANGFLYKCHHLRDMAWTEDDEGKINFIVKKWKAPALHLKGKFGDKVHKAVNKCLDKEPLKTFECFHVVMRTEEWDGATQKWIQPYVSIYVDKENNHVIEEAGVWSMIYEIPRWQTVSGSQYAYSPATIAALPDARLIQAITLTLLDAGERAARPPLLAVGEALKSDVNLVPDGITILDAEYDERSGDVLRPLIQDKSGLPFGYEMRDDVRSMITEAFYLNKIAMPAAEVGRDMTAFEVGQRVQEYIRQALPLFEPMETEYNGAICEATFNLGLRHGLFGPDHTIPKSIQGREIEFRFQSPLTEAQGRKKGGAFLEAKQLLAEAAEIDQNVISLINAEDALRDALKGVGVPTKWTRDEKEMAAIAAQNAQKAAAVEQMANIRQGAEVAEQVGVAGEKMSAAQEAMQQAAGNRV